MKTAICMSPIDHQLEIFTASEDNLIARKMITLGSQSKLSRCNMLNIHSLKGKKASNEGKETCNFRILILAEADAVKST